MKNSPDMNFPGLEDPSCSSAPRNDEILRSSSGTSGDQFVEKNNSGGSPSMSTREVQKTVEDSSVKPFHDVATNERAAISKGDIKADQPSPSFADARRPTRSLTDEFGKAPQKGARKRSEKFASVAVVDSIETGQHQALCHHPLDLETDVPSQKAICDVKDNQVFEAEVDNSEGHGAIVPKGLKITNEHGSEAKDGESILPNNIKTAEKHVQGKSRKITLTSTRSQPAAQAQRPIFSDQGNGKFEDITDKGIECFRKVKETELKSKRDKQERLQISSNRKPNSIRNIDANVNFLSTEFPKSEKKDKLEPTCDAPKPSRGGTRKKEVASVVVSDQVELKNGVKGLGRKSSPQETLGYLDLDSEPKMQDETVSSARYRLISNDVISTVPLAENKRIKKIVNVDAKNGQRNSWMYEIWEKMITEFISLEQERIPTACYKSEVEKACGRVRYITEAIHSEKAMLECRPRMRRGCECRGVCGPATCPCSIIFPQSTNVYQDFLPLIYECNSWCRCSLDCPNRATQRGTRGGLEIYRTEEKGWGVRTAQKIPKGTFICEYVGEIITMLEAKSVDDTYLFALPCVGRDQVIDAQEFGNISRFLNHSCEPNVFGVYTYAEYSNVPRVCFFSTRTIEAQEELCFNYGDEFWNHKPSTMYCCCNSEACKYPRN